MRISFFQYMSLEKLFTGSATAKILDVLWEYQDIDLTITDIADEAGRKFLTFKKKWLLPENPYIVLGVIL